MKIEKIPTDKLIPYARNAKRHDAAQVSKLAGSIKEFGFNNPVLIDKENGIIAGHGRVMAAQQLALADVPCIRLGHLTDNQRRAYILADNRLAEINSGWDEELLKLEVSDIDWGDIKGLSVDDFEFSEIDFGGAEGSGAKAIKTKRKVMNSFFCLTDRPFKFLSRLNEDVNTYVTIGARGGLFLTINQFALQQCETQTNAGGMSDAYLDSGTFVKSFYTVMYAPSCTRIAPMGAVNPRLHHKINWQCAVPKILSESLKRNA